MSTLKINRPFEFVNGARNYSIFIDGNFSGKIKNGQRVEFPLSEGKHTVKATIDWCSSNTLFLHIHHDEIKEIKITGLKYMPWILMLGLLAVYLCTLELWIYAGILLLILAIYTIYYLSFGREKYLKIMDNG